MGCHGSADDACQVLKFSSYNWCFYSEILGILLKAAANTASQHEYFRIEQRFISEEGFIEACRPLLESQFFSGFDPC